jgi:hypothetical protein
MVCTPENLEIVRTGGAHFGAGGAVGYNRLGFVAQLKVGQTLRAGLGVSFYACIAASWALSREASDLKQTPRKPRKPFAFTRLSPRLRKRWLNTLT